MEIPEASEVTRREEWKSTSGQIRTFMDSSVWKDIKEFLEGSIGMCQLQLEATEVEVEMLRLQGALKELRTMLSLPAIILEELEELEKEETEKEEGGEKDVID